jgi:hypothetical protein
VLPKKAAATIVAFSTPVPMDVDGSVPTAGTPVANCPGASGLPVAGVVVPAGVPAREAATPVIVPVEATLTG